MKCRTAVVPICSSHTKAGLSFWHMFIVCEPTRKRVGGRLWLCGGRCCVLAIGAIKFVADWTRSLMQLFSVHNAVCALTLHVNDQPLTHRQSVHLKLRGISSEQTWASALGEQGRGDKSPPLLGSDCLVAGSANPGFWRDSQLWHTLAFYLRNCYEMPAFANKIGSCIKGKDGVGTILGTT